MDRGLDSLHLLGEQIFYPCQNARNLLLTPQLRNYPSDAPPTLPIPPEEDWLYRHFPLLLLEYHSLYGYTVNPRSALNVLHSLRFTLDGHVAYMHPALLFQLAKYFLSRQLQQSDIKTNVILKSSIYTGDPRLRHTPVVDCITKRYAKLTTSTMQDCKGRGCSTPSNAIHPRSRFIVGADMCSNCIHRAFRGDMSAWISISQAKRSFAASMLEATVLRWCDRPLRFVLIGIALESPSKHRSNPRSQRQRLTLDDYERIGRDFYESPADRTLERWPLIKLELHHILEVCDPLPWRQVYSLWKFNDQLRGKLLGQALIDENFRYFGWSILPLGTRSPHPFVVGQPLRSIDGPDNDSEEHVLREIQIPAKDMTRRFLMRGTTYTVWRRILHGFKLFITATSTDYEPNHHDFAIDASIPLDPTKVKHCKGDVAIYHAEHATYGSLARVMSLMQPEATLYLYGSITASIAGKVKDRPIREGVLAELIFTFRYFELNAISSVLTDVRIKEAGPELIPLCAEVSRENLESLKLEENLLVQKYPVPALPASLPQHPAWRRRLRMPILLQQLDHVVMRDVQLPLVYIEPLMPHNLSNRKKRRKIQENSLIQ